MIKDDGEVIHFNNPKVQASLAANTFAVSGHAEIKRQYLILHYFLRVDAAGDYFGLLVKLLVAVKYVVVVVVFVQIRVEISCMQLCVVNYTQLYNLICHLHAQVIFVCLSELWCSWLGERKAYRHGL